MQKGSVDDVVYLCIVCMLGDRNVKVNLYVELKSFNEYQFCNLKEIHLFIALTHLLSLPFTSVITLDSKPLSDYVGFHLHVPLKLNICDPLYRNEECPPTHVSA